jgi:hypothetical protein
MQGLRIVGQHRGSAARVEAAVEQVGRKAYVVEKDIRSFRAGDAEEIEVDDARSLRLEPSRRLRYEAL